MGILTLGTVDFDGFELPAKIDFGGRQQLAVHRLIGGGRVIDVLGRDDGALSWSGVLSGPLAADRARTLDAMRAAGPLVNLTWNAFCYSVVVAKLDLQFQSAWWISYKIRCVVYRDEAQAETAYQPSLISAIASDLSAAGALLTPVDAAMINAVAPLRALTLQAFSAAAISIATVQKGASLAVTAAENSLASRSLSDLVIATGTMALSSRANIYLSRALVNMALQVIP